MAAKRNQDRANRPQGAEPDIYEHKAHARSVIPSANESNVREVAPPEAYAIDPHDIPRLEWYGKGDDTVVVPTYTIHQHEAVNPLRLLSPVRTDLADDVPIQLELFGLDAATRSRLRADAVFAYDHLMRWTNRMIAGDSLLVMNALLAHERMAGKVQCVYMDPPYGIRFGSNFMPTIHKRDVKDGKDEDLSSEVETVTAFRDTWKHGIHSYLSYLRDRILLIRELLHESGSLFLQISIDNVHRVRCLLDEIFGADNCVSMITYATTSGNESGTLDRAGDYILWYAKNKEKVKYHDLFKEKVFGGEGSSAYKKVELANGKRMSISDWEKMHGRKLADLRKEGCRAYTLDNLTSQGKASIPQPFEFQGKIYFPGTSNHWKPNYPVGMQRLVDANRIDVGKSTIGYIRYFDDFPFIPLSNHWGDTLGQNQLGPEGKVYVVQTSKKVIERCLLMTTEPGDLVLDPTCGSGTTAVVAEEWGRRWITIDTSRVALALAKRRLITQVYPWYRLADEGRGIDGGLVYRTVPHVMLGDIANGVPSREETLWDRPFEEKGRVRVTGPFTVEALPAPTVEPLEERPEEGMAAGASLEGWVAELRVAGIQVPGGGERLRFQTLEIAGELAWFHARGVMADGRTALVCLGSASAPLGLPAVRNALEEADKQFPKPQLLVFAAFQFTAEAMDWLATARMRYAQVLTVQMNTDLQNGDLLRRKLNNQSFFLVGQPDVTLTRTAEGTLVAEVRGFDYYDPVRQRLESQGVERIAMWMVDGNYDGQCVNPMQVFFPRSDVWERLGESLRGRVDAARLEAYVGAKSLPFTPGPNRRVAVKIIDERGYESLRVFALREDGAPRETAR